MKRPNKEKFEMLRASRAFQRKTNEKIATENKIKEGFPIAQKNRGSKVENICQVCKREWTECVCGISSGDPNGI